MQFFSYQFSVRLKMLKLLLEWNCKVSKEGERRLLFLSLLQVRVSLRGR